MEHRTVSPRKEGSFESHSSPLEMEAKRQVFSWQGVVIALRTYSLFLGNVAAWYFSNGMNGISMQSFASSVKASRDGGVDLGATLAITSLITATQLLLGAVLGYLMLLSHKVLLQRIPLHEVWDPRALLGWNNKGKEGISICGTVILPGLHGIGSLCTNLGFMYGSASLVQIIKLLEPFETLGWTKLLLSSEAKTLTVAVMSSMILTVGSAMSLLESVAAAKGTAKKQAAPQAILFAILSGLTLSLRNVLQRQQVSRRTVNRENSNVGASAQDLEEQGKLLASSDGQSGSDSNSPESSAATIPPAKPSKLEASIIQFTELSLYSGLVTTAVAIVLHVAISSIDPTHAELLEIVFDSWNFPLLAWHPLYNAFSMITLGFVSAVTHSLLNAGKRVFAIAMAVIWFRESFNAGTILGLVLVLLGGCWYTAETKGMDVVKFDRNGLKSLGDEKYLKPGIAGLLLLIVFAMA